MKRRTPAFDRKKFQEDLLQGEHHSPNASPSATLEAPSTRMVAEFSAKHLRSNYRVIQQSLKGMALLPMIKANGYGHGMLWVARELSSEADLYAYGVATLEEGAALREGLGLRHRKKKIIVFCGALPWSDEKGQYCEIHGLTPVIGSEGDWRSFLRGNWHSRIPYELEFNTGMNRLGLPLSLLPQLRKVLAHLKPESRPQGIFSHLAQAESPETPLSRKQLAGYLSLREELESASSGTQFHLGNSAAIWNQSAWRLTELCDVARPGLSLYGIPPWSGAPARGIEPVMTLKAPVLMTHELKEGDAVGYGARFRVARGEKVRIAVLGSGYADGTLRALSGLSMNPEVRDRPAGRVWLGGKPEPILGVVSMDLCTVRCGPQVKVGDWAEWIGGSLSVWDLARSAETIPYELLTSIGSRVQRKYEST